jgi:hypothetical protein
MAKFVPLQRLEDEDRKEVWVNPEYVRFVEGDGTGGSNVYFALAHESEWQHIRVEKGAKDVVAILMGQGAREYIKEYPITP